jgi:eukaryotic-like serine/threonine-protein kinase
MTSCPDENLLVALAEGALEGANRVAIDQHLDACAECSRLVGHLASMATPARTAPARYRVIRQLGEGSMGVVWEAEDTELGRRVALKFIKPEGANDPALRRRLIREARALAKIHHVNVISVYEAGEADDEICLVLELVEGESARAWAVAVPRSVEDVLRVWSQAAAGIAAVHRAGIVHRDIKPDNVFVASSGRVVVGDFGLATGNLGTTMNLTVTGAVVGTPLYMSPEQLGGGQATPLSDQFALCASIWEALAGERPFRGTTIAAIARAMTKPPELPRDAVGPDRRVFHVLRRGLAWEPADRFPNVDALQLALSDAAGERLGARVRHPPRTALYIGGVLTIIAGAVVGFLLSSP